jgi:hypothetical protein
MRQGAKVLVSVFLSIITLLPILITACRLNIIGSEYYGPVLETLKWYHSLLVRAIAGTLMANVFLFIVLGAMQVGLIYVLGPSIIGVWRGKSIGDKKGYTTVESLIYSSIIFVVSACIWFLLKEGGL